MGKHSINRGEPDNREVLQALIAAAVGVIPVVVVIIEETHLDEVPVFASIAAGLTVFARILTDPTVTSWARRTNPGTLPDETVRELEKVAKRNGEQ